MSEAKRWLLWFPDHGETAQTAQVSEGQDLFSAVTTCAAARATKMLQEGRDPFPLKIHAMAAGLPTGRPLAFTVKSETLRDAGLSTTQQGGE